jgi:M6 family metalloprotease-like protein
MSMPFVNKEFTFTQPDGTQLRVRGTGDQHSATFETLDGYTVVRDPSSVFFYYARLSNEGDDLVASGARPGSVNPQLLNLTTGLQPSRAAARAKAIAGTGLPRSSLSRWQERRNERRLALHAFSVSAGASPAPPPRTTVGQFVGLCLLIQFPDVPGVISREEVEAFCNKPGYNGFGNNGSVRDYFFDNSGGRLTYTNVVAPYYTARHPRSYYTNETIPDAQRAQELIKEAIAFHRSKGFNFDGLTLDNQNIVYAVNAFHAGPVVNHWPKGLWPHSWHFAAPYQLVPGRWAKDYQITNMGDELTLGTFCHENGHMICDFPDLYSFSNDWYGAGFYCLMCFGGMSPNEKNPAHIGAYLKHSAGWARSSSTIAPGSQLTLQAAQNEFAIYRRNSTEYFIVENRVRAGRDAGLTDAGLAIWLVDELGSNTGTDRLPSRLHECALVQADGRRDLENHNSAGDASDLFRNGLNDRLDDTTTPKASWMDGSASGLKIQGISAAGPSMSFST